MRAEVQRVGPVDEPVALIRLDSRRDVDVVDLQLLNLHLRVLAGEEEHHERSGVGYLLPRCRQQATSSRVNRSAPDQWLQRSVVRELGCLRTPVLRVLYAGSGLELVLRLVAGVDYNSQLTFRHGVGTAEVAPCVLPVEPAARVHLRLRSSQCLRGGTGATA